MPVRKFELSHGPEQIIHAMARMNARMGWHAWHLASKARGKYPCHVDNQSPELPWRCKRSSLLFLSRSLSLFRLSPSLSLPSPSVFSPPDEWKNLILQPQWSSDAGSFTTGVNNLTQIVKVSAFPLFVQIRLLPGVDSSPWFFIFITCNNFLWISELILSGYLLLYHVPACELNLEILLLWYNFWARFCVYFYSSVSWIGKSLQDLDETLCCYCFVSNKLGCFHWILM